MHHPQGTMQYGGGATGSIAPPQQSGLRFEDTLNGKMRVALHDFVQVATIANWCADECLGDPSMTECARVCRDVADLASLNVEFISRGSSFGLDAAETFALAAEQAERVCSQYPHEHCQECASAMRRAIDSTWDLVESFQQPQRSGEPSGPVQYQGY